MPFFVRVPDSLDTSCWQGRLTIERGSVARAIFAAAIFVCASGAASAQDAKNPAPPSQVIATGAPGDSATGEGPNTGQDITNPVTRVDLREFSAHAG